MLSQSRSCRQTPYTSGLPALKLLLTLLRVALKPATLPCYYMALRDVSAVVNNVSSKCDEKMSYPDFQSGRKVCENPNKCDLTCGFFHLLP